MQAKNKIIDTYNKVASKYAGHFINELDSKPLDRLLLQSFYEDNEYKGAFIDLGCGPGQTTKFLAGCGCTEIIGADISPAMIAIAKEINPGIKFEVADLLELKYQDNTFNSAVAFYAIVHFDYPAIKTAFKEINRILQTNGQVLFSFHAGDELIHRDELLEEKVDIDFYFLDADKVISILNQTGFKIIDAITRYPYETEFQSKRTYIRAEKVR